MVASGVKSAVTSRRRLLLAAVLVLSMLTLLLRLGFWQLERAHEKERLQEQQRVTAQLPPVTISSQRAKRFDSSEHYFRKAIVVGRFDGNRQFLLDNRTHNGRAGYHVLSVMNLAEGAVLVNRGWVPVGDSREVLPATGVIATNEIQLLGRLTPPPRPGLLLGDSGYGTTSSWPRVVQTVDFDAASNALGATVQPFLLLLDANDPHCLVCEWAPISSIDAATHRGYALQWFALAAALVILSLTAWRKSHRAGQKDGQ